MTSYSWQVFANIKHKIECLTSNFKIRYYTNIYSVSGGYLRRIPVERRGEYATTSKTVACNHHYRLEPRNLSVFCHHYGINDITDIIISGRYKTISNRTADTVVCHISLLYRLLKEHTRIIRNYIRDVINYIKRGFSLERGILPITVVIA